MTEAKRRALLAYRETPNPSTLYALRSARNKAQQTARYCANTYWLNLYSNIKTAANMGDARGMYEGIKKATDPSITKTEPLKSKMGEIITDQGKQLQHWMEHYLELYATQNVVMDSALNAIQDLLVMDEPTMAEVSKAIDHLASGKATGSDSIPSEVLKSRKSALLQPLYDLLYSCWKQGYIPQDMRDATIITLFKNKGDQSDCNNYRGISLLSIVGKVFARHAYRSSPLTFIQSSSVASDLASLHIHWQDKVSNTDVLDRANMYSMFAIICERHLRWLGHVRRMDKGCIPKDLQYSELAESSRLAWEDHVYVSRMSVRRT